MVGAETIDFEISIQYDYLWKNVLKHDQLNNHEVLDLKKNVNLVFKMDKISEFIKLEPAICTAVQLNYVL